MDLRKIFRLPMRTRAKATPAPASMQTAFDAARASGYRGWFWFPHLDPARQITQWTREETARKINWLYNNNGALRLAIDGLSLDEVDCGIWPRPVTSNPDFNRAVSDAFENECGDPRFFDEAAVENFYTQQLAMRRHIRLHGELFGQLLRSGQGSNQPTLHTIPAYQVGTASSGKDQSDWPDGVRRNAAGRALAFRFLTNADRTAWTDVPAGDVLHFHDEFWKGQTRGISSFASVARKLFSMDDIERAETTGTLLRTRLAYAVTRSDDDGGEPTLLPGATSAEVVESDAGTKTKLIIQRIVAGDNTEADVADIPAGRDIKIIESQKGSAAISWNTHLLTEAGYATLYPPEYVFFLGGLGSGTMTRLVQKRVQRVKNSVRQFQLIPQFCRRWYNFWLWQRIATGRFASVPGGVPADWYRAKMICPADDTIDVGREGRLYDDRVSRGNMSPEVYFGMQGEDADDAEDEIIAARVRRIRKIRAAQAANPDLADDITYDEIFRPPAGTAAAADPAPAEDAAPAPAPRENAAA